MMKTMIRKILNLSDIKHSWLLILSMFIFLFSLYNEKMNPSITLFTQWITYGSAILSAILWSVLNYVAHIHINAHYKRYDHIDTYVDNLVMTKDERLELKSYLNDFVSDLVSQGKTKEEATQIAINQFRVEEFSSMSKNSSPFDLPIHYYLIGYVLIDMVLIFILAYLTHTLLKGSFLLAAIEFMLISYGVGFLGLFILYKVLDMIIYKKLSH